MTTTTTATTTSTRTGPTTRRGAWVRRFVRGLVHGRADTARWERPAFLGLLSATAVLYLVGLSANGWANSFYSAAVQAGSESWEAFFYGSSDAGNSITVDKPPAFLWVMELSVRLFGLNSWAILVPEAIMGVLSVALLCGIVRRRFSAGAALVAGAALATTPVATLMFRFDNPDALLVLLTLSSIWLVLRGVETGRLRYVVWAGVAIGFAFLTKQLQAFLVLPVLVGVYLYAARMPVWRRVWHLLVAAAAIAVSAGWWVAIVELVPSGARPYVGGSQTDSFLELTFGYNGLGRVTGDETGSVTGGGGTGGGTGGAAFGGTGGTGGTGGFGGAAGGHGGGNGGGMWGSTGIGRLFGSEFAGQVTWLLPAALVLLVVSVVLVVGAARGRAGVRRGVGTGSEGGVGTWSAGGVRTSPRLATIVVLGGSLLVTGLVFSFMGGIFHPYYTIALAPYIAGLVGIGATLVWEHRARLWVRIVGAATVLGTAAWQWTLLSSAASWQPWIRWVVVAAGVVAAVLLLVPVGRTAGRAAAAGAGAGAGAAEVGGGYGPDASHPATAGQAGAPWYPVAAAPAGRTARWRSARSRRGLIVTMASAAVLAGLAGPTAWSIATVSTAHTGSLPSAGPVVARAGFGGGPGGRGPGGQGFGGQGFGGQGGPGTAQFGGPAAAGGTTGGGTAGGTSGNAAPVTEGPGGSTSGRNGGMGGLLGGDTAVSSALRKALEADASDYTWVAAAIGSNNAATYQLATEEAVMPIGGFNGSDPSPTLAQFKRYVAAGEIHWFIAGEVGRSNGGSDASSAISSWVESHFEAQTIGGVTVYDLTTGE